MICFLDSSALVKRYVAEAGSDYIGGIIGGEHRIVVSWLAYPETLAAITRRAKGAQMSEAVDRFRAQLKADFQRFLVLEAAGSAIEDVERVIIRHALRGADSIHLATVLWFARTMKEPVVFVASDLELLHAAQAERLMVIDPVNPSSP
jgi:predicted nucleic acid-binding protein